VESLVVNEHVNHELLTAGTACFRETDSVVAVTLQLGEDLARVKAVHMVGGGLARSNAVLKPHAGGAEHSAVSWQYRRCW